MAGYIGVFILGAFVGCVVGILMLSLCVTSKNADISMENMEKEVNDL